MCFCMHICLKAMKGLLYDAIESAPSEEGYFSFIPSNFHRMFCLKVVRNGVRAVEELLYESCE